MKLSNLFTLNINLNKLIILGILPILILVTTSCSVSPLRDANLFLHVQKGKSLNNYFKQYKYELDESTKEYSITNFKFKYNNKELVCNLLPVVNAVTQSTTKSGNTSTTTTTYITDRYFVITDDTKNKIVLDGFYKYEIFNGTRNESYLEMFEQINKSYMNYLIDQKVYTLEEIKEMTELEKINKLSL